VARYEEAPHTKKKNTQSYGLYAVKYSLESNNVVKEEPRYAEKVFSVLGGEEGGDGRGD
jgi:hypothetical protein